MKFSDGFKKIAHTKISAGPPAPGSATFGAFNAIRGAFGSKPLSSAPTPPPAPRTNVSPQRPVGSNPIGFPGA